jgi:hypothetical protein
MTAEIIGPLAFLREFKSAEKVLILYILEFCASSSKANNSSQPR